ncbi:inactive serine protease 54-like [Pelodytes ibericus]
MENVLQGNGPVLRKCLKRSRFTVTGREMSSSSQRGHCEQACGVRKDIAFSSNPFDASLGEFPWQVSVQLGEENICSGTIISEFWIVSAAQCLTELQSALVVEVGVINLNIKGRVYPVKTFVRHREYNADMSHNNIGLLESSQRIQFNDVVQPACYPEDHLLQIDQLTNCWVTSWREQTQASDDVLTVLQKMAVIPTEPCHFNNMQFIMCAKANDAADMSDCTVDSGDSLVCQYGENKAWTLVGIVSIASSECDSKIIFARTASYITWIKENTATEGKPVIPGNDLGPTKEDLVKKDSMANYTVYKMEEIPDLIIGDNNLLFSKQTENKVAITALLRFHCNPNGNSRSASTTWSMRPPDTETIFFSLHMS